MKIPIEDIEVGMQAKVRGTGEYIWEDPQALP